MLKYLPETIQTFSTSSRKTVSSLIQSIKGDKTQIRFLVQNLRNFDFNSNYSSALALRYSSMNLEAVVEFFRDSSLRMTEFYSASASVSNIINSLVYIFSSEIEKIEKDIKYLENFIDNYQFISGENDLFNFNYVENFDNDLASHYYDMADIPLFDRDNISFGQNGNYYIDPSLSKMIISNGSSFINVIDNIKSIKETSNYSEYTTTNSDFYSTINDDIKDAWTVTAKAPVVLTSHLKDVSKYVSYDYSYIKGAETLIELEFVNPIEMDFIRIYPNETSGLQLLQVVLTKTDSNMSYDSISTSEEYTEFSTLNSPLLIDRTVDVVFSKSKVKKILFILLQSKYTRSENVPNVQETNSKVLSEIIKKIKNNKANTNSTLQDLVYFYFKRRNDTQSIRKNEKNYTEIYSKRYPSGLKEIEDSYREKLLRVNENVSSDEDFWKRNINSLVDTFQEANIISNIVQSIVEHSIESRSKIFNNSTYRSQIAGGSSTNSNSYKGDGIIPIRDQNLDFDRHLSKTDPIAPGISRDSVLSYLNSRENSNYYEYSFSIKSISFGLNSNLTQNKACFISKKIETQGAPIAIKAIVNKVKQRPNLNYQNYDLTEPGSYELSVTYKDVITKEEDWIPIPAFNGPQVEAEVIFFNDLKEAGLRFIPAPASIRVYKNAVLENPSNWSYSEFGNKIVFAASVEDSACYSVTYLLSSDLSSQNIVDIDALKDSKFSVKSFSKDGTNGEIFSSSGPGNKLVLSYIPYVEDKFKNATYNSQYGTLNSTENEGYSPVTITLADGTVAVNLTNYIENSTQKPVFYNTSGYLFVQSGKEIIFNKPVNQTIAVNYSYIPSSLRFRLIIRNTIANQFNGISIDNVIIKSKVKNLDTLSNKLIRLR